MIFSQNCKYIIAKLYKTNIIQIFIVLSGSLLITSQILNYLNIQNLKIFLNFESLLFLLISILQGVLILAIIAIFRNKESLTELIGLKKFSIKQAILSISLGFLAFFIIAAFIQYTGLSIPGFGKQIDYTQFFGDDKYSLVVSIITVVIIAPITEEIFFRGFLFSRINKELSLISTNLLTALCFATIHLQPTVIIPLFILGYIIGTIRIQTKSVVPCIIFHLINNGLALYAQYNFT